MRILLLVLFLLACQPEKIVYIEVPVEVPVEEERPVVRANVTRTSNSTNNGTQYITAYGKVVNQGPGRVYSVRVVLTSDVGYARTVTPTPSILEENEWGDWEVSGLQGSYIKYKDVLFSYGN